MFSDYENPVPTIYFALFFPFGKKRVYRFHCMRLCSTPLTLKAVYAFHLACGVCQLPIFVQSDLLLLFLYSLESDKGLLGVKGVKGLLIHSSHMYFLLISGYFKPEIFRIFLDWGYSERLKITKENTLDLVLASDYILAPALVVSCAKFLVSNALTVENAWQIFNLFQRIRVHFDNEIEYEHLIALIKKYIKVWFINSSFPLA